MWRLLRHIWDIETRNSTVSISQINHLKALMQNFKRWYRISMLSTTLYFEIWMIQRLILMFVLVLFSHWLYSEHSYSDVAVACVNAMPCNIGPLNAIYSGLNHLWSSAFIQAWSIAKSEEHCQGHICRAVLNASAYIRVDTEFHGLQAWRICLVHLVWYLYFRKFRFGSTKNSAFAQKLKPSAYTETFRSCYLGLHSSPFLLILVFALSV